MTYPASLAALFVLFVAMLCPAADKPNVLFIAIDDLNDWIGALGGHPQSSTPNLDRLAARGTLFTNGHCAAPACNPSRAALMTGIRPSTSGVYHNPQPWRKAMPNAVTLSQHFMQHGYTAMGAGKIYHGRYPDPASWDVYFPSKEKPRPADPGPAGKPLNGIERTGHFDWGPLQVADDQMSDHKVVEWVTDQLQQDRDKPFFLACGIFRPHLPWYVPQKYFDQFPLEGIQLPKVLETDLDDVPAAGRKVAKPDKDHSRVLAHNQWKHAVQGYLASIAFTDAQVGRLLDALDTSPDKDNTIVVLWTDHGWHLGEKQHWRKFALWERATRTPMMFVVPGLTQPGQRCDRPVNLLDIYPTLVDICDLPARGELEGVSLKALLANANAEWDRPSLTTHGRNNHALRSERYRYIRYADGSEELYDHTADPNEWNNLASEASLSNVKAELAKWFPAVNAEDAERDN